MKDSKFQVLYVDDNRTHVSLMKKVFEHIENSELIVAYDGVIGRERAKRLKPDLLLLDINLPRLNGMDIAMQLRSLSDFKNTPMFALTAEVMLHQQEKILNSGIDYLIPKPFDVKEFIALIGQAA